MESIDVLGARPDRQMAFTGELLAEAEDQVLQVIVEEAGRDLSVPIAMVNLVLEEIQFFKARYGLPLGLAAARATERDVSFCKFVVRDGEPFEVTNAEQARATAGRMTTTALASFLRLMEHTTSGGYTPPERLKRTLKAAQIYPC